ncbi:MAG TPA: hypothetical protein VGF34_12495 [Stellaceae bacterium]|jgi:hypothetical protein
MSDRLVLLLLLAGSAVFGATFLAELGADQRDPATAAEPALRADPPPPLPERESREAEPIAPILARPLFSSTRRPPQTADASPTDTGLSDTRLTGILIAPGRHIAIFAPAGAKLLSVTEGQTMSGWRIDSITPTEVSLSGPEGTKTLQPKFDPNLAPPTPPQPEAAAAAPPTANPGQHVGVRTAPGVVLPRPGAPVLAPRPLRPGQRRR